MARKVGLGRGLSALIPDTSTKPVAEPSAQNVSNTTTPTTSIPIDQILPNPQQPRTDIPEDELQDLTNSIRQHGIIQALLVSRQSSNDRGNRYQLIAGERRWRAALKAGLTEVPVTIREATSRESLELAIIENVQRADLNPLEEGLAYQKLITDFSLTQQQVAERIGRSRTVIANAIRLIDLPSKVSESLARGEISAGHARALLGTTDVEHLIENWKTVITERLNVRQTEELVRAQRIPEPTTNEKLRNSEVTEPSDQALVSVSDPGHGTVTSTEGLAAKLQNSLGTKVTLRRNQNGTGTITIHFYSDEELNGIFERLIEDEPV